MNKIIVVGRTTKDIDVRTTKNGKTVASFVLASDRRDGGTDFFSCFAWEGTARLLEQYVHKGDQIVIWGRLSTRAYEKNGENRIAYEIVVDEVTFVGNRA